MGYFFAGVAAITYFLSLIFAVNGDSAIGAVIVATLFVICSVLCYLGESIGDRFNELNEQVLDVAADIAWFKERESRQSRGQR